MCGKQQASRLKLEKWRGHRSRIEIHRMIPEFLLRSHTSSVAYQLVVLRAWNKALVVQTHAR